MPLNTIHVRLNVPFKLFFIIVFEKSHSVTMFDIMELYCQKISSSTTKSLFLYYSQKLFFKATVSVVLSCQLTFSIKQTPLADGQYNAVYQDYFKFGAKYLILVGN